MGLLNRVNYMSTLIRDKITGGRSPLVIALSITPRCNYQCNYCYGQYYQSKEKEFSLQELKKLINDLGKMGTRSITFEGGEPLIRNDIGKLIEIVKQNNIECGFNTNGSLIPLRIKELKNADMICVSLDGPKKYNDLNRGNGTFDKTVAGIDAAIDSDIKVHISAVMTRYTCKVEVVDWIIDFVKKRNIQAEFNFLFQQSEDKKNSKNLMADNREIRKIALRILKYKKTGAPILFSDKVYQMVANWPDYKKLMYIHEKPKFKYIPCQAGRFMMFLDVDGKVYPCVQLIGRFSALDFRKVGIKKAWENCANYPCHACYFPCFNEFSSIANLDLGVIYGQIISTLKNH